MLLRIEDLRTLLEEIVARQQNPALTIDRVIVLLDDRQHSIDSDLVAAASQCLRNVAAQTEAELPRA